MSDAHAIQGRRAKVTIQTHPELGRGYWWEVTTGKPGLGSETTGYCFTLRGARRAARRAAEQCLRNGSVVETFEVAG